MASVLLEARPYRPFKSSEEYLEAMREDLAEWLNTMYPELMINSDNFMDCLDTGVALCKHANNVRQAAEDYIVRRCARNKSMTRSITSGLARPILSMGNVHYLSAAKSGTFFARDNVSNFITWCRKALQIFECLLFETDDLIMRKNEKHVILCLLEVARRGAKFGMLAPMLIQMERQIDREIAADNKAHKIQTDSVNSTTNVTTDTDFDTDSEDEDNEEPKFIYGPLPQIITNDLQNLEEMVRDLLEKCTCPSQFPMIRVSEGKYRIGDTKVLIFVRILRSHVMVRVGGGWDTLSHYLDKHDPCRCKAQHRSSIAAKLVPRTNQNNSIELHKAQVIYERSPPSVRNIVSNLHGKSNDHLPGNLNLPLHTLSVKARSRSPTPQRKLINNTALKEDFHDLKNKRHKQNDYSSSPNLVRRSASPIARKFTDQKRKQTSLESNGMDLTHVNFDNVTAIHHYDSDGKTSDQNMTSNGQLLTDNSVKFETMSDNGSEISDEGYRSLGLIQSNNAQKQESFLNQTLIEDAENNAHPNLALNGSQSPSNEILENLDSNCVNLSATLKSLSPERKCSKKVLKNQQITTSAESKDNNPEMQQNNFEQSGIFITDDDITIDIASATGLRKTNFSNKIYGNGKKIEDSSLPKNSLKKISNKIPRSPVLTRKPNVDSGNNLGIDNTSRIGVSVMNRKQPIYTQIRKPKTSSFATAKTTGIEKVDCNMKSLPRVKNVTNTWSGPASVYKKRSSISIDTFVPPNNSNLVRNSKSRSSTVLFDSNGRHIRSGTVSLTTSPIKNNVNTSPLAKQLLETAGNAKNDAQILDKMKQLLTQYSSFINNSKVGKLKKSSEYDDFTEAWVHNNSKMNQPAGTIIIPEKGHSKHSSAASSTESMHNKDNNLTIIITSRKDRGLSKIPAPVRNHTELY